MVNPVGMAASRTIVPTKSGLEEKVIQLKHVNLCITS